MTLVSDAKSRSAALAVAPRPAAGQLWREVLDYCAPSIFQPGPEVYIEGNPYRRPVGVEALGQVDFSRPLAEAQFLDQSSLAAHRMLCNAYESDMVLLPPSGLATAKDDFDLFYGDQARRSRDRVRPDLERFAFSFLDESAPAPAVSTIDELQELFMRSVDEVAGAESETMRAITQSRNPEQAAGFYLIQLALDALTEASAMARNLGGAYGLEQSEMFKIFIDEFGYGVYDAKHSTLFRRMLASVGLRTDIHAYWNFYLTSSLAGVNYFNYLTEDHRGLFRYMGAVTYLEWIFAQGFADAGTMLRSAFGDRADVQYCDEHAHIDVHHGKMTYENLLLGFARAHGDVVIGDLARGIEEIKLLMRLGDADFLAQIRWADTLDAHRNPGQAAAVGDAPPVTVRAEDPFCTQVQDQDQLLAVAEGEVDLHAWATDQPCRLGAGDTLFIPRSRLHGLKSVAPRSVVSFHPAHDSVEGIAQ